MTTSTRWVSRGSIGGVRLHQSLFGGRMIKTQVPASEAERAARSPRPTKDATRLLLDDLPAATATTVVIEFATPVRSDQIAALATEVGLGPDGSGCCNSPNAQGFFEGPPDTTPDLGAATVDSYFFTPLHRGDHALIGYPALCCGAPLATEALRLFAQRVRASDRSLLQQLGLPRLADLEQIAADGLIYGVIVRGRSPAVIRAVLDRPAVRSVTVAEVAFNTLSAPEWMVPPPATGS